MALHAAPAAHGGAPKRGAGLNRQNTGVSDMNKGPQRRSSQAFMVDNRKIHNTIHDSAEPRGVMEEDEEEEEGDVSESRAVAASNGVASGETEDALEAATEETAAQ